jgi:hypothetical protein
MRKATWSDPGGLFFNHRYPLVVVCRIREQECLNWATNH